MFAQVFLQTLSYSYDGLDRLTSASCNSWSHTYSYDKAGNRIEKDGITYTVNAVNEVTELSDGTTFTYDLNGNRTQKTSGSDTWVYTYNYANQVTSVVKNDSVVGEYMYDGDDKRIQVVENNGTTTYIYSGLNALYEETMTGRAGYIYGPTGRIAKRTTMNGESHMYYYHTDHQYSTRLVTDESKNVVTNTDYEPFGESTVAGEESYLYTGKEKDETGLYYYGAWYYDPDMGRFLTKDPLTGQKINSQSLNRYTYCLNNPVKSIDPTGLVSFCNVDTGNCYRPTENGYMVILANGEIITKEDIDILNKEWQEAETDEEKLEVIKDVLDLFGIEYTWDDVTKKLYVAGEPFKTEIIIGDPNEYPLANVFGIPTRDAATIEVYVTEDVTKLQIWISRDFPDIGCVIMALFHELSHVWIYNDDPEYYRTHKTEVEMVGAMMEINMFKFLRNLGFVTDAMKSQYNWAQIRLAFLLMKNELGG